jgi:hypothetical protein
MAWIKENYLIFVYVGAALLAMLFARSSGGDLLRENGYQTISVFGPRRRSRLRIGGGGGGDSGGGGSRGGGSRGGGGGAGASF